MRARVTIRGLVPLGRDGSDVVGIGVVPWAEPEPVYEAAGPAHDRFIWMDERGRVVRRRELGWRAVFVVAPPTAMGKRRKGEGKRLATPRRAWMRAMKGAAREGSLVVARDQRGAWWLEVAIWSVALALGVAAAVWWFQAQVAPLLGSSDAASVALVILMGIVCVCSPGTVLVLMSSRFDVIRGRVARWSRIDASGIRAGWSPKRAKHFSWEELADANVFGLQPYRIETNTGREAMLSVSARGLEWINQMIWEPRVAAMETEADEWDERVEREESERGGGEEPGPAVGPSDETLAAMAAERRAFERRWRRRAVIGYLCVGVVIGTLLALLTYGERGGSWAWTLGAGAAGFVLGSLVLPLVLGVLWVVGTLWRIVRARKDRRFVFIPARITLSGLVPVDAERARGIGVVPWTELWRGPRGYEWRDAERRWVRLGLTRERVVLTLDPSSARSHEFEEAGDFERLLRRAARQRRLRTVVDQRSIWCVEAFVLGMEVVVPTLCAAAMVATVGGPLESWGVAGWFISCATGVGTAALTFRDWRELWRSPVRVRADSTGLVLRMITGRKRRVEWGEVRDVRRAGDMRITTARGHPFCMVSSPRMDALLDAHIQGSVRHEPEREPFNARNVLRFAMLMGLFVGFIGIYAMVSNGKPVFPGAVHAGMFCGGMVLAVSGLLLGARWLKPHVI